MCRATEQVFTTMTRLGIQVSQGRSNMTFRSISMAFCRFVGMAGMWQGTGSLSCSAVCALIGLLFPNDGFSICR